MSIDVSLAPKIVSDDLNMLGDAVHGHKDGFAR
jgi:hypothetical protein